jgi:16S rRNA (cytosine967-C5)-methyltransferase
MKPPHRCICVNTTKTTKSELAQALRAEGMSVDSNTNLDNSLYISKTGDLSLSPAFKAGLFHIMDESSMLAAKLLGAKAGDTVIDVCAAPGGKSFAIAESMDNTGVVYSRDCYEHKVSLIADGAERLGLNIIKAELKDAAIPDNNAIADCVVVDAPCSGLGLVSKKPDIKYTKTREDIAELAKLQRKILKASVSLVKPGGKLLYSTCTVSYEENAENVRYITEELGLEPIAMELPDKIEYSTAKDGYIEILPSDYGTDGFFISLFRRK